MGVNYLHCPFKIPSILLTIFPSIPSFAVLTKMIFSLHVSFASLPIHWPSAVLLSGSSFFNTGFSGEPALGEGDADADLPLGLDARGGDGASGAGGEEEEAAAGGVAAADEEDEDTGRISVAAGGGRGTQTRWCDSQSLCWQKGPQ